MVDTSQLRIEFENDRRLRVSPHVSILLPTLATLDEMLSDLRSMVRVVLAEQTPEAINYAHFYVRGPRALTSEATDILRVAGEVRAELLQAADVWYLTNTNTDVKPFETWSHDPDERARQLKAVYGEHGLVAVPDLNEAAQPVTVCRVMPIVDEETK
jgi:hypothetical protein